MENIKEQLEEVIKKNLPEKRLISEKPWLDELGRLNLTPTEQQERIADREFNLALSQINTSLIADEVLKVVVEKIRKVSFIDLYIKYKNDRSFTIIDEILDIGIKEDLLSNLSPNKENK